VTRTSYLRPTARTASCVWYASGRSALRRRGRLHLPCLVLHTTGAEVRALDSKDDFFFSLENSLRIGHKLQSVQILRVKRAKRQVDR
jgi:hypothetical protein